MRPLSPAGLLQREAALFDGLASGSARPRKAIAILIGALVVFMAIILIGWGISALGTTVATFAVVAWLLNTRPGGLGALDSWVDEHSRPSGD